MIVIKVVEIFPTEEQINYFNEAFNVRKEVWNYLFERFVEKEEEFNEYEAKKDLNNLASSDPKYSFFNNVNSMVRQECLRDFRIVLDDYKSKQKYLKKKNIEDINYGRPLKKEVCSSFKYNNKGTDGHFRTLSYSKHYFYLTTSRTSTYKRLKIKCAESLLEFNSLNYRFCEIVIKQRKNGRYFAGFTFDKILHKEYSDHKFDKVGIDMGIKHPLTCVNKLNDEEYDAYVLDLPRKMSVLERRIDYENSLITKKDKTSNNYLKHQTKIQKLWDKLVNLRKEFSHQNTNRICRENKNIVIEDFDFPYSKKSMLKNSNRTMMNVGRYRFLKNLKQKAQKYSSNVYKVKKGYASTQTCSCCGYKLTRQEKLTLRDREFKCPQCKMVMDRDINAAINVYNYDYSEDIKEEKK